MKPNILFLVIDSGRSDRIFGKHKKANTPNIDSLVEKGVYFTNAISCTDYTGPSIQAMFTSRFPFGCGIAKDYYYKVFSTSSNCIEILKNNDYNSHAILEEALCTQGIERPFDDNYVEFKASVNLHNGLDKIILEKFDSVNMKEPWFYYIHFMDLHKPCIVPEKYNHLKQSERYDFNLSTIDTCIGKILEKIDISKTLIIITADHGDYISPLDDSVKPPSKIETITKSTIKSLIPKSLKTTIHEKKQSIVNEIKVSKLSPHEKRGIHTRPMSERFMFDDVVKVPLLFSGYGINKKSLIHSQIRTVDIFPTILELIGLPKIPGDVNGQSLVSLIKGEQIEIKPAYMESSIIKTVQKNPRAVIGIRTENYKYFRDIENSSINVNLYDLKNDPLEENNIANTNSEKIQEMEKIMDDIRKTALPQEDSEKLSEQEEKELEAELKKLGYL